MTEVIARTGRVQSWMDDPTSRLPVSCTVFVVDNQMEGPEGIEASWRFASHALRYGAGCAIHLSELDPKNFQRPSGVTASGPVSFGKIYSTLNEILRRGGVYKNGAIVLHLDMDHPDCLEFIQTPRSELPGLSDASTSQMIGGRRALLRRNYSMAFAPVTFGSTK